MPLTRAFKETVMAMCEDPEYRKALLLEALEAYLEDDIVVGNSLMRDYLNGTGAFAEVADELQIHEAGLRRMMSATGNATAKNLFRLFKVCQRREGIASSSEFLRDVA